MVTVIAGAVYLEYHPSTVGTSFGHNGHTWREIRETFATKRSRRISFQDKTKRNISGSLSQCIYLSMHIRTCIMQGMLTHVVVHQPEDPIAYFHEEVSRIKKEVEENNVSIPTSSHTYTCPSNSLFLHSFL